MQAMNNPNCEVRELISRAGMSSFFPMSTAYIGSKDPLYPSEVVPLNDIEPFVRGVGVPNFNERRALYILDTICNNTPLPPVRAYGFANSPYKYQLFDGFHRYHISIALGFTEIPVGINPWKPET